MKISISWLIVLSAVSCMPTGQSYQTLFSTIDEIQTISPYFTWDRPIYFVAGGKTEGKNAFTEALIKKNLPRKDGNLTPTMITMKHEKKEHYSVQVGSTSEATQYDDYQSAFDQLNVLMNADHQDVQTPFRLGINGPENSYLRLVDFKGVERINDESHGVLKRYKDKYASHRILAVSSCESDIATSFGYQIWNEDSSKNILVFTNTEGGSCSEGRKKKINTLCESNDNVFILPIRDSIYENDSESYKFNGTCLARNRFGVEILRAKLQEISDGLWDEAKIKELSKKLRHERTRVKDEKQNMGDITTIPPVKIGEHVNDVKALLEFSLGLDSAVRLKTANEKFNFLKLHHLSSASEFLFKAFKSYIYYTVPAARFLYIPPDMNVDAIFGGDNTQFTVTQGQTHQFTLIPRELLHDEDDLDIYPAYQPSQKSENITVASAQNPLRLQMLQMAKEVYDIAKNDKNFLEGHTLTVQHFEAVDQWKIIAEKYVESLIVMAKQVFKENIENHANFRYAVTDQSGNEVKLGSEWVRTFGNAVQKQKAQVITAIGEYANIISGSFTMADKSYLRKLTAEYEMYFINMYFPDLLEAKKKDLEKEAKKQESTSGNTVGSGKAIIIPTVSFYENFKGAEEMEKISKEQSSFQTSMVEASIPTARKMVNTTRTFIGKKFDEFMKIQQEKDAQYNAARQNLFRDLQMSMKTFSQEKFVHYLAEQCAYFNIRAHDFMDTVNVFIYTDLLHPAVEETRKSMADKLRDLAPNDNMQPSVTPEMQNTLAQYNRIIELVDVALENMS